MKKCPACAEEIQNEAVKCKHCGEVLKKPKRIGCGTLFLGVIIVGLIASLGSRSENSSNEALSNNQETSNGTKYYVPSVEKYPLSALFARDYIDFMTGKLKSGTPGFDRIERHNKGLYSNKEFELVGSCYAKFLDNQKSDFPPSGCKNEELERFLITTEYATTNKASINTSPNISQRFGRFSPQAHKMVSLGRFFVFANPKPGLYFIRTGESMNEVPKVLRYAGKLANDYHFSSQDIATYIGTVEYRIWATESIELLDVYSLE